jgi:hypothetical protein
MVTTIVLLIVAVGPVRKDLTPHSIGNSSLTVTASGK